MSEYYSYMYLRIDGTPYYVGKGKGNRAYDRDKNHYPPSKERIVIYPAVSEADAFETEIALIWYYGRKDLGTGCLRNLTDGGENPPKRYGKRSKETCRRISEALAGKTRSPLTTEHKKRIGEGLLGREVTSETRIKIGKANKGKNKGIRRGIATEFKKGLIPWGKGIPRTAQEKKKLSDALKGKPWTAARRAACNPNRVAWNKGLKRPKN
ncbi:MAG: NUMOD3 domain-containing DNA-binding protein [Dehalococcoidia bacterium]